MGDWFRESSRACGWVGGIIVLMTPPHPLFGLQGYVFDQRRHAAAILTVDYPEVCDELHAALANLKIWTHSVVAGGGGKSVITQDLERRLNPVWRKKVFRITETINDVRADSTSHEIDHFREFEDDRLGVALEIEWNNKDPFYDRDLSTFARLHALGAISVGIVITRGPDLRKGLKRVFEEYYAAMGDDEFQAVVATFRGRDRERLEASSAVEKRRLVADRKFSSKYGEATTHWTKLMARIERGVGNPCPLLLIGIQESILKWPIKMSG